MKNLSILLLSVFLFLLPLKFASAEKVHGIAMHGTPKYSNNFTHLDYVNPNAPKGGTVKFGSYGSFDNLNRVAFKGSKAAGLGYVNDTLMRRVWDEAFSLYGLIAEKVELPEDRSSITFYLNSNATFHDGSPITRDDVLFSLETFQTKGTPNQKKTYGKVVKTELIGNDGIKMIFENNEDKELPLIIAGFLPIIPKKFYVSQNYPNPFNPSTSFYIDMPEAGNLSVKVFDVNGRVVKELINTYVNSGRVQARWSGKNEFDMMSPTGIYFLRVETSTNYHVQKLALVK